MAGKNDDLELKQLGQFYGSEKYHNVLGANVTDGVHYIMQNGYSWFVTDFLISARMKPKLKKQEFLSALLVLKDKKAEMVVTDGNNNVLYTQKYEYTDAKKELQLFFVGNVLMLENEY